MTIMEGATAVEVPASQRARDLIETLKRRVSQAADVVAAQEELMKFLGGKVAVAISFPAERERLIPTKRVQILAVYSDDNQVHYGVADVRRVIAFTDVQAGSATTRVCTSDQLVAAIDDTIPLLDPNVGITDLANAIDIVTRCEGRGLASLQAWTPYRSRLDPSAGVSIERSSVLRGESVGGNGMQIAEYCRDTRKAERRLVYALGTLDNSESLNRVIRLGDVELILQ